MSNTDNMLGLMYQRKAKELQPTKQENSTDPKWKYAEGQIVDDFRKYLVSTYGEHYMAEQEDLQCFDAWIALGDATPTFRNTAIKYLWRYGKKGGSNKKDLMKTLHYTLLCLYNDHYKDKE